MKQQILKLAKRLNNFAINEVAIMSETDEMNVQKIFDELENEGFIKKISPLNYLYIPKLTKVKSYEDEIAKKTKDNNKQEITPEFIKMINEEFLGIKYDEE